MTEFQYANPLTIASSQALDGSRITVGVIQGLNIPIHTLGFLIQWTSDITRTCTASGGPSDNYGHVGNNGRDDTNFNGWRQPLYNPPAAQRSVAMFSDIEVKSNNTDVVKRVPLTDVLVDWRSRFYKGDLDLGIPMIPFAYAPTLPNCVSGAVDMFPVDAPTLYLYTNSSPNSVSTVAAYVALDLATISGAGTFTVPSTATSSVTITPFGIGYSSYDIIMHDISRPTN